MFPSLTTHFLRSHIENAGGWNKHLLFTAHAAGRRHVDTDDLIEALKAATWSVSPWRPDGECCAGTRSPRGPVAHVSCGDELTEAVGAPAAARLSVLQFGLKEGFLDQRGAKRPRHHPLVGEVTKTKILCRPDDRRAGSGYVLDLRVTVEICRRCAAAAVVCTVGWKREGWRRHRSGREGAPKFRE